MLFLAQKGFRVVAHDRRGHGRSSQASLGNDMNGYADDLAAVIIQTKQEAQIDEGTAEGSQKRSPSSRFRPNSLTGDYR
jgi:non-heme chloroperoxidase